jgi:uncharacterized membrane protein (UPF0127 family)
VKLVHAALLIVTVLASPASVSAQRQPLPPWREPLPPARATAEIVVGDTPLAVDLALAPAEQSLGLGYRNGLAPGTGMLFVFPDADVRSFWMKGMRFCLDIVWIVEDRIAGAAESVCPDPEGTADADRARFRSGEPVTHVLEVPAGWLDANGYGAGTPVELPEELR